MQLWKKVSLFSLTLVSISLVSLFTFTTVDFSLFTARDYWGMFCFFLLALLVVCFPINIGGTNIAFIQIVTLTIFLQFGLLIELIITQLAIIFFLLILKVKAWQRYVLNIAMFLTVSVTSAGFFHLLQGDRAALLEGLSIQAIIPVLGYVLASVLVNHLILYLIQTRVYGNKISFFSHSLWWETIPLLLISPIGMLLFILYQQFYIQAIIYMMIPVVTFSVIFRLYSKLNLANDKLKIINRTGNIMSRQLDVEHVIDEYMNAIGQLVRYQHAFLFLLEDPHTLRSKNIFGQDITKDKEELMTSLRLPLGQGLIGTSAKNGATFRILNKKDEICSEQELFFLEEYGAVMAVPLRRGGQMIGVVVLATNERVMYTKEEATLIETVSNQAAVAIKNAEKYQEQKKKSEIDELTGLYNFRYFEHELFKQIELAKKRNGHLTLILLDIDHFKKINDTYGHLAGNKILRSLAQILVDEIEEVGLVARYGGEEFTILLSNTCDKRGYHRAEELRKRIEGSEIQVDLDLADGVDKQQTIKVSVTVSVGIATYPVHADDPLSLIRHADRAMYLGAKRNGRNKVAVYEAG